MVISSKKYYNKIASSYKNQILIKNCYLKAIEREIFKVKYVRSYMDVACGDGTRSFRIINRLTPKQSVLIDESKQMLNKASLNLENQSIKNIKLINIDFLNYQSEIKFDLITCLWNVFGHLPNKQNRLDFLKKIHDKLDDNGILFIDINNRYNINHYGFINVLLNILKDTFNFKNVGRYKLSLTKEIKSVVYIHKPKEFDILLKQAGFSILEKKYIDYRTGIIVKTHWKGQILYKILKKT